MCFYIYPREEVKRGLTASPRIVYKVVQYDSFTIRSWVYGTKYILDKIYYALNKSNKRIRQLKVRTAVLFYNVKKINEGIHYYLNLSTAVNNLSWIHR